jgi:hypothetical protein
MRDAHDIFQPPQTYKAFQQYEVLVEEFNNVVSQDSDKWGYIWGLEQFSVHKAYTSLSGHMPTILFFSYYGDQNVSPNIKFSSGCYSKTS